LTILAYLWGYGFKIYYNGEEIIYKSVLSGERIHSVREISEIIIKQYFSEPEPYAIIKFNDGSRIKIQYYFTGYHYIMGDLKEKVPDYLWKDARIRESKIN
jgi:hypothetical protein